MFQYIIRERKDCCDTCKYVKLERYCGAPYEHYCNVSNTYPCNRWSAIYETDPQMKNWHSVHFTQKNNICVFYEREE